MSNTPNKPNVVKPTVSEVKKPEIKKPEVEEVEKVEEVEPTDVSMVTQLKLQRQIAKNIAGGKQ